MANKGEAWSEEELDRLREYMAPGNRRPEEIRAAFPALSGLKDPHRKVRTLIGAPTLAMRHPLVYVSHEPVPLASPGDAFELFRVNPDNWQVQGVSCHQGESTQGKDAEGNPIRKPTFTVSATFRPRVEEGLHVSLESAERIERIAKKASQGTNASILIGNCDVRKEEITLEIMLADPHFGKTAGPGQMEWTPEITAREINYLCRDIIETISLSFRIKRIILPIGNDLIDFEPDGATTKKTRMPSRFSWRDCYEAATGALIGVVEKCRAICRDVEVITVEGNHDRDSTFVIGHYLKGRYEGVEGVNVDCGPQIRKYRKIGSSVLGLGHGDGVTNAALADAMTVEARDLLAGTQFAEFHKGHIHKYGVDQELSGIVVRSFDAIAPSDDWHGYNAYVGARRNATGIVWSDTRGPCNFSVFPVGVRGK